MITFGAAGNTARSQPFRMQDLPAEIRQKVIAQMCWGKILEFSWNAPPAPNTALGPALVVRCQRDPLLVPTLKALMLVNKLMANEVPRNAWPNMILFFEAPRQLTALGRVLHFAGSSDLNEDEQPIRPHTYIRSVAFKELPEIPEPGAYDWFRDMPGIKGITDIIVTPRMWIPKQHRRKLEAFRLTQADHIQALLNNVWNLRLLVDIEIAEKKRGDVVGKTRFIFDPNFDDMWLNFEQTRHLRPKLESKRYTVEEVTAQAEALASDFVIRRDQGRLSYANKVMPIIKKTIEDKKRHMEELQKWTDRQEDRLQIMGVLYTDPTTGAASSSSG